MSDEYDEGFKCWGTGNRYRRKYQEDFKPRFQKVNDPQFVNASVI